MSSHVKIKNEFNETVKAGCVVINENNQVLLVKDYKKVWTFPKGHAEANETLEQVALRETKEETGYAVQIVKRLSDITYSHPDDGEDIRVAMFLAEPVGKPEKVKEDTYSEWFDKDTARQILAFNNLAPLLDELAVNNFGTYGK